MSDTDQRLHDLLDALQAGSWEWALDTGEFILDASCAHMLGYSLEELLPVTRQKWINMTHPEDRAHSLAQYQALMTGLTDHYQREARVQHQQGHWLWILDNGRVTERDEHGTPLTLVGVRQDISLRKRAEHALREESERFRALTHSSNTGVWEWDEAQQRLWCGPEYFNMLGRDTTDFLPDGHRTLENTWVQLMHPDDRARASQVFTEYCASDGLGLYECEFRLAHSDGSWVWVWSRGNFLLDSNGRPTQKVLGTHINITERKQHEQHIQQLNASLEQRVEARTAELSTALDHLKLTQQELLHNEKLASLGALVAGIAHELNTPIGNALILATTLNHAQHTFKSVVDSGLSRRALTDFLADIEDSSHIIERNLSRAAELISSFKQLAVDQTSYQRRTFNLQDAVHEVCLTLRPTLRQTPYRLQNTIPADLSLDSYPGPITQVLINLINNAIAHGFRGRATGNISLSAQLTEPGWMCLTLCDDGVGINAEEQKKIFDPFFTTSLGLGGSGLGLHISHTLVTGLLGGRIELTSAVGEGACFTLHLPLIAPATAAADTH